MLDTSLDPLSGSVPAIALAARLAAQLSRDTERPCDDIGRDAVAMALAARQARAARCADDAGAYRLAIARLAAVADLYGLAVIEANDPSGMIVGLDLGHATTHRTGHPSNWYYLA